MAHNFLFFFKFSVWGILLIVKYLAAKQHCTEIAHHLKQRTVKKMHIGSVNPIRRVHVLHSVITNSIFWSWSWSLKITFTVQESGWGEMRSFFSWYLPSVNSGRVGFFGFFCVLPIMYPGMWWTLSQLFLKAGSPLEGSGGANFRTPHSLKKIKKHLWFLTYASMLSDTKGT